MSQSPSRQGNELISLDRGAVSYIPMDASCSCRMNAAKCVRSSACGVADQSLSDPRIDRITIRITAGLTASRLTPYRSFCMCPSVKYIQNKQPTGCNAQLAIQMTYKPSKLGQTDQVSMCSGYHLCLVSTIHTHSQTHRHTDGQL